ncbi:MAG: hypothetical protein KGH71_03310 [Candidatus Micrarchaeota archaeon]|nr:hypothetical protein [Candidatus Micrarchaeota archaeon]
MLKNLGLALFVLLVCISTSHAASGGAYIYASAVSSLGVGNLTVMHLTVTPGNGNVKIIGPQSIANDTLLSASSAVNAATAYLGKNKSSYNFTYTINYTSVSGPSGGLALSLLAVSALSNTPLVHDFAVTGTISNSGAVGEIGGIYEKSKVAVQSGKQFMIVPFAGNGTFENSLYYIVQQKLGIPVVKVSNLTQALPYAFGQRAPRPFAYNITQNYHTGKIPALNLSCENCDTSSFGVLANATINLTSHQISQIRGNYSSLESSLRSSLLNFTQIANKGYLYTGADLSFLEFSNAYLFANSNFTRSAGALIIKNVSGYCGSLVAPQMTAGNYEYVIGGELRQSWALQTLNTSANELATAEITDDVAQSIYGAANAYAWCFAASQMYKIASTNTSGSVILSNEAIAGIHQNVTLAQNYSGLYSRAALASYNEGLYGAALYNSKYAMVFGNSSYALYSKAKLDNLTIANIANSTGGGIWPYEFSAHALFFLGQQSFAQSNASAINYAQNAYSLSLLSSSLAGANMFLSSGFVPLQVVPPSPQGSTDVAALQEEITQIYQILFLLAALTFISFLIIIYLVLRQGTAVRASASKTPGAPKAIRRAGRR